MENGGGELILMLALRMYIDLLYGSRKRDKLWWCCLSAWLYAYFI